jgi:hypothetical protein
VIEIMPTGLKTNNQSDNEAMIDVRSMEIQINQSSVRA